jgi:hypothetical protein
VTTSFYPAFMENSRIIYSAENKNPYLSILIKCFPEKCNPDTFYFTKKLLKPNDILLLDSILIKVKSLPIVDSNGVAFDGMPVTFNLVKNEDSTNRIFLTPGRNNNPLGYLFTSKAISTFKTIFNDPLVSDYFDRINDYIDDSTFLRNTSDSEYFKQRKQMYSR